MRPADLLHLSLSALWQQKLRTVLTMLGVAFGALVLFISISLGIGVQETIGREARKIDLLRRITVHPRWEASAEEIPAEALALKGDMSEERRERLKQTVQKRWQPGGRRRRVMLSLDRLVEIAGIEHVERVRPDIYLDGWAHRGGKAEHAAAMGAAMDDRQFTKRLLTGAMFPAENSRGILVSELLVYRWGLTSDADLERILGTKIRLEVRSRAEPAAGLRLLLFRDPRGEPESREAALLREKLRLALPEALTKLELSPEERQLLEALLKPSEPAPTQPKLPKEVVLNEEFTIAGVFRMPDKEDQRNPWEGYNFYTDLVLPPETAKELYLQLAHAGEEGFGSATVMVDREENVKQVLEQIEALGLQANALTEFIQREQFLYKLIFAGMTCVAAVALLVAGLGITNTMLMSVLERTREVGIMKAVGAAEGHIQLIFLIEGALIGLVGGGLGVLLSWGFSFPGDRWIRSMVSTEMKVTLEESLFVFPPWLIVSVVMFCGLVTVLAALYPARRAARVNAVTALRHE